jgi:hypothetical protein
MRRSKPPVGFVGASLGRASALSQFLLLIEGRL